MNGLKSLEQLGQAVWLDFIRRSLITSGELQRLVEDDGLRGVTSNPSIFEKAIVGSTDYAPTLDELYQQDEKDPMTIYERVAIPDIQAATDVFRPVYERTKRRDGYVSLEVSPFLAHETQKTVDEARRLWKLVGRENVMIKVPGTPEGVPAIQLLLSEGININVTLLFAQQRYEQVAEAFISGLEALAARGGDVSKIGSVASFFVSRIDSAVDSQAAARLKTARSASERALLRSILGKVAIANAKLTYQRYKEIFQSGRWKALEAKGAKTQRLLWASTSAKNPKYRDVLYVEELIGPDTVNTIPMQTLEAFRDHGRSRLSLEEELEEAHDTMQVLEQVGISMKDVTDQLLREGVRLFADAFDQLLNALDRQCKIGVKGRPDRQTYSLSPPLLEAVKASIEDWHVRGNVRRLWSGDASLWTGADEGNWLGWLGITEDQLAHKHHLESIATEAQQAGFTHALLLGMGGSSLCPEVMAMTFGKAKDRPELHILDSTDPAQIKAVERRIDVARTLFIVSSKSGSTLEPNIFKDYFFDRARQAAGEEAGSHFIAITDPGSKLQQVAESEGFRSIFYGVPSIGGRYSALSDFGMAPAAVMGVDVARILDNAEIMATSCSSCVPIEKNPGVTLGLMLGTLAREGRDKVTIITSPGIRDFGAWLEQLLAESTGKQGKGLIPVDREELGPPEVYGNDRVFVYLRLESAPGPGQDAAIDRLEKSGQPVVRISLEDKYDLGREFFRWEVATAVAGSVLGINPFNQPDVETSKVAARKLTAEYEKTGALPAETPILNDQDIKIFADAANAAALAGKTGAGKSVASLLKAHFSRLQAGDYLAILAYVEMSQPHEEKLQAVRHAVRDARRVATCLGFGPRFQHSTGQAYKGGPNTGVFIQVTCDDAADLPVPGHKFTFGVVKAAQARGDFQVLAERKRRLLRVHLGPDVSAGLAKLQAAVHQALA